MYGQQITDYGLSLRQTKDKCRKTKGRAAAGNMDSRSHGITEICFATPRQLVNETFASPDNETTRQRVGRQPVGFAGIMEPRIYGITD